MKITREINGLEVKIELTANEMSLAYQESLRTIWRDTIKHSIEMNSENLRFTEDFDKEDFVSECMEEMEGRYYADDWDERVEEIVFDVAEVNDIWEDD